MRVLISLRGYHGNGRLGGTGAVGNCGKGGRPVQRVSLGVRAAHQIPFPILRMCSKASKVWMPHSLGP
jgi:hypothetical protein